MYETRPEIREIPGCQSQMQEYDDNGVAVYHQCIGRVFHDFGCVCKCGRRWSLLSWDSSPQPTDPEPTA